MYSLYSTSSIYSTYSIFSICSIYTVYIVFKVYIVYIYCYIYICIYVHIYIERERDSKVLSCGAPMWNPSVRLQCGRLPSGCWAPLWSSSVGHQCAAPLGTPMRSSTVGGGLQCWLQCEVPLWGAPLWCSSVGSNARSRALWAPSLGGGLAPVSVGITKNLADIVGVVDIIYTLYLLYI